MKLHSRFILTLLSSLALWTCLIKSKEQKHRRRRRSRLALRPISYVRTAYDLYGTMFVIDPWRSLTDPTETAYHPYWAPTLLFELFFNILAFLFCVLLIALFLKKRFAWPRAFAGFLVLSILGMALDIFFVHHIPVATESISSSIRDIVISGAAAAIWIPYLYRSKRVKATFRY